MQFMTGDNQVYNIIRQMQEGRRYRGDEVYVRDWKDFLKVQKTYDFIKTFNSLTPQEYTQVIKKNFIQLAEDEKFQCFVFPNSLKPEYLTIMIDLVKSNEFKLVLDYQHESLYMDNAKQLVIFKKRASVASYLSKYRLTKTYQQLFRKLLAAGKQYQALLVKRNIKISLQAPQSQIAELTKTIQQFSQVELQPKIKVWRDYVIKMVKDFKKQEKKQQLMFLGVSSLIVEELKVICQQQQLYFSNRYEKVSVQDEYRDVLFTKVDRSQPSCQFDDRSSSQEAEGTNQESSQNTTINQESIVIHAPKNVENVSFQGYAENGVNCIITILSFGKSNPIDYLRVRLVSPKETQKQKNYQQRLLIAPNQLDYDVVLHCLHHGCSIFQVTAVNSVGVSKKPFLFKIWMSALPESINNQGIMKIDQRNYTLHILGQNQEGVIPNWDPQSTSVIATTDEKWQTLKFGCSQFSVSSHGTICNRQGDVASWGKMYYFDIQGLNQDNKSIQDEEDDDELGLAKMQSHHYRIQKPCSILESSYIRKVSCGEGYCLMADSLGRAWSFGINNFGQLGLEHLNQSVDTSEPTTIRYFTCEEIFVTDVVASYFGASFAIDEKGKAYRWGTNQIEASPNPIKDAYNNIINYQYPDIVAAQSMPIPINKNQIAQKILSIHPGMQFVLAVTEQNTLYGWGKVKYFGMGAMKDAHFKIIENMCNPIPINKNIRAVSVGLSHCVAAQLDGTLIGWGETNCYNWQDKSKQFTYNTEEIRKNYHGRFVCGPDFTVYEQADDTIRVVGNQKKFKQKQYKLPCKPIKIQAGDGVIMLMSDPKTQSQSQPKPEVIPVETKPEEIKVESS